MSLDHYVSQVYLKNFRSPELGRLYAIRKSDLKEFTPDTKSVCRIEEGSTNPYLQEPRIVEEFLRDIEPKYNAALEKLATDSVDPECVYVIAGFVAYVLTCSPAGMRIQSKMPASMIEEIGRKLEREGSIPPPPPVLGGKSFTELIEKEKIFIKVDPKYPQAIGITNLLSVINTFGNSKWDILVNTFGDSPFFTSDFPVAIEKADDPRIFNRIIPLAPELALRIRPDITVDRENMDSFFAGLRYTIRKLDRNTVAYINRLIVRCAEKTVFFRNNYQWIPRFVKKNANFRIEPRTHRIPSGDGTLLFTTMEICEPVRRNKQNENAHTRSR
ncbi:MAG: DUF4238 domain-containing protein [Gammaproteobacteria bacterium]|nr:DUF4238 domain-containing protein [Gammaproteobacteria bacterium]NNJ83428.1 DUF4238 domain-containing protein [Gammaproteobacteria bacterium]